MPFRPAPRPPDLERVARVLGSSSTADPPGEARADGPGPAAEADGGWVPHAPGGGRVASAVQRLSSRVTEEDEVSRLDADLRRARRPGLLTVPDELRTGRRAISSAAVVSLLALVLAVGCVFVLRVLWAERSTSVQDVAPGSSRSVQVVGGAATTAAVPGGVTTATGRSGAISGSVPVVPPPGAELVVHVVGQVVRPGLVRLRPGARLADAIAAAGGARPAADLAALNLARLVIDGEQIRVPRPGEAPGSGMAGPPGSGGGAGGPGSPSGSGAPVSLNSADVAALDSLPGVGPVLAQRIIDWRTQHGRFTSVDELGEVSGIGDKLLAQLRPKVTL